MLNLTNPATVKALLQQHGFTFSKALGQNFLINPSVCPRMAELGGAKAGYGVLEIGPGIGVLTQELAQRADKVVAVELDQRLFPLLQETLSDYENIRLIQGDILKVDLAQLFAQEFADKPVVVCANLPYYITSPVLMRLLETRCNAETITVMVQKEAAVRICAQPGTRETGAVSIAVRYFSEPELLFSVSRGSFLPAPNVDSCVIRLRVRNATPAAVQNETLFFQLVRAAFSQRRKRICNPISQQLHLPKSWVQACCDACGISADARAEQLSMEQWIRLCHGVDAALAGQNLF